jgi:hypothetical protein
MQLALHSAKNDYVQVYGEAKNEYLDVDKWEKVKGLWGRSALGACLFQMLEEAVEAAGDL